MTVIGYHTRCSYCREQLPGQGHRAWVSTAICDSCWKKFCAGQEDLFDESLTTSDGMGYGYLTPNDNDREPEMTAKAKKPTNCTDCGIDIRKAHRSDNDALCINCFEDAALENDHQDNGHPEFVDNCPLCDDREAPTLVEPTTDQPAQVVKPSTPTGRKNFDHSACNHDNSKGARAACRKAMAKLIADLNNS